LDLKIVKFRFYLKAEREIYLPKFKGAAFRGLFGTVFKSVAREMGFSEIYEYIFNTLNDGRLSDYSSPFAPKPFVLEAPLTDKRVFKPGEIFRLDFILTGRAINYAPALVFIFDEAGRSYGLGKWRSSGFGNYSLEKVTVVNENKEALYYQPGIRQLSNIIPDIGFDMVTPQKAESTLLIIEFLTPTHIVRNGSAVEKNGTNPLSFEILIRSLYRRLYYLLYFHQSQDIPEFQPEPQVSGIKILRKNLSWKRLYHYSNRQKTRVPLYGFTGSVVFKGFWQPFWPLLKLGELLHIGKETTFGFGQYHLSSKSAV